MSSPGRGKRGASDEKAQNGAGVSRGRVRAAAGAATPSSGCFYLAGMLHAILCSCRWLVHRSSLRVYCIVQAQLLQVGQQQVWLALRHTAERGEMHINRCSDAGWDCTATATARQLMLRARAAQSKRHRTPHAAALAAPDRQGAGQQPHAQDHLQPPLSPPLSSPPPPLGMRGCPGGRAAGSPTSAAAGAALPPHRERRGPLMPACCGTGE